MKSNDTELREITSMNYEEAFNELEGIVETLEKEELSLESSINLFERGKALSSYCKDLLNKAELRIKDVNSDGIN